MNDGMGSVQQNGEKSIRIFTFQDLLLLTDVTSMQKVKVKGQGHRDHDPT